MNLATVERVLKVEHHPNADKLDIIRVLGYDCIVGRDAYKENDLVVFIQPDSILPIDKAWAQEPLRYCSRARVKAIRLRGSWSMGLVLNLSVPDSMMDAEDADLAEYIEGDDLTEMLGVTKYEPPLPTNLQARGGLPFQIPKTDEERYQNLRKLDDLMGEEVDVTLKIDGSSATYYCLLAGHWPSEEQTRVGLCSRSLELKLEDEDGNPLNSRWHEAERRYDILRKLRAYCEENNVSLALRGEVYGVGIQSLDHNPHSLEPINFAAYSVYNITDKRYERLLDTHYSQHVAEKLGIPHVPVLGSCELSQTLIDLYDHGSKKLDGKPFEGVVIQHQYGSFKVINKWYDAEK